MCAEASEAQPGTLACIHMRNSEPAPEHLHMEKEVPGTRCTVSYEQVVGLELMSSGVPA